MAEEQGCACANRTGPQSKSKDANASYPPGDAQLFATTGNQVGRHYARRSDSLKSEFVKLLEFAKRSQIAKDFSVTCAPGAYAALSCASFRRATSEVAGFHHWLQGDVLA